MSAEIPLKAWQPPPRWNWRDDVRQRLAKIIPGITTTLLAANGLYVVDAAEDLGIEIALTCLGPGRVAPYHIYRVIRVDHAGFWNPCMPGQYQLALQLS
jgi:hypothetical protein